MRKVLVTGMAGFIAAEVSRQLLRTGIEVVGVDNLNDYYDPRLKQHRLELLRRDFSFEFHQLDIEDADRLDRLIGQTKVDCVFNLAARAGVAPSVAQPELYFQTNLMGSLNVLQSMVRHQVPKLVLASTSSVYAGEPLPFIEEAAVNRPISPYAASKKAAEQLAYTYTHLHGLSCSVVRYFTVYGPAGRPDMSPFRFMRWIDEGQPITLFGDGRQSRDFTYVEDIARGTVAGAGAARAAGYEIFNLGGGLKPIVLLDMIAALEKGLGKKAKIDFQPALKADMKETQANASKAKSILNWTAQVEFAQGLDRTLEWYRQHRDFVLSLRL